MKKKTVFATVGAGLSLALAAVALGGFVGNRQAKEIGASTAKTLVINAASFSTAWTGKTSTSYVTYAWSQAGSDSATYTGSASTVAYDGTAKATRTFIQLNSTKYPYLYNTTAVSYITGITVVTNVAQPSARTVTPYLSADAAMINSSTATTPAGTALAGKAAAASSSTTLTWTADISAGYKFFCVAVSGATYIDSITITFEDMPTYDPVTSFDMTVPSSSATTGDTLQISSAILPASASQGVSYVSSDASIAGVDNTGLITAYRPGTVTITGTTSGKNTSGNALTDTVQVTVTDNVITTTEANTIGTALADNAYTAKIYKITGTITAINTAGRSYSISDGTTPLVAFGSYNQFASDELIVGGTATFRGMIEKYVKSGATTIELTYNGTVTLDLVSYTDAAIELAAEINGVDTSIACATKYTTYKAKVIALSAEALSKFETSTSTEIANARARYVAWCTANNDSTPYASGAAFIDNMTSGTALIAVAIVSVLGLLTLAGVMVIRKKHN